MTVAEPARDHARRPSRWLVATAVVLAVAGVVVTIWRPVAPHLPDVVTNLDDFEPEVLATVRSYRLPRLAAALAGLALTVLVPVAVVLSPWGRRAIDAAVRLRRPLVAAAVIGLGMILATRVALLPLTLPMNHSREVTWEFRTAGLASWLRDWVLAVGVEAAIAAVAAVGWLWLVRRRPHDWHWWLVPVATALTALLVLVQPLLIQPLFLETSPLPAGPLHDRLDDVLDAAGMDAEIEVGDASRRTTRVNAFVTGLGPTRQVVLWDTLLARPVDEVAAVVAHEVAHREHRDLPRGVLLTATGVLPFAVVLRRLTDRREVQDRVGAPDPSDPRMVAILAVAVALAQVLALPSALWASRRAEAAADHRALELTRDPDPLIRTFRGFVTRDLSWPAPPLIARTLFGTHPSPDRRIRSAVEFATSQELDLPDLATLREAERAERHPRIP